MSCFISHVLSLCGSLVAEICTKTLTLQQRSGLSQAESHRQSTTVKGSRLCGHIIRVFGHKITFSHVDLNSYVTMCESRKVSFHLH
ncbi:protein MpFRH1 [Marchantia polymorpha subsp. ruderalis]